MDHIQFMRDLEERYKRASGLRDRSQYKIFYSPVRPADILVLGINPGGSLGQPGALPSIDEEYAVKEAALPSIRIN